MARLRDGSRQSLSGTLKGSQSVATGDSRQHIRRESAQVDVAPEIWQDLAVKRESQIFARQRELEGLIDKHDDLVREAFHLEKFVTLLHYDPKVAKEDQSVVFQEYKAKHDLLAHSTAARPSRQTRRALNERLESLKVSAAQPSSSTPSFKKPKNKVKISSSLDGIVVPSSHLKAKPQSHGQRERRESMGSTTALDGKGKQKETSWDSVADNLSTITVRGKGKGNLKKAVSLYSIGDPGPSNMIGDQRSGLPGPQNRKNFVTDQSFQSSPTDDISETLTTNDILPFPDGIPRSLSKRRSTRGHRISHVDQSSISGKVPSMNHLDPGRSRRANGTSQLALEPVRSSVGGKTVASKTIVSPDPPRGRKHKADEDLAAWMPRIKRVKLTLRLPPPSFSHPAHRPPPPKYGKSLSSFLSSYIMVDGVHCDELTLEALAQKEGKLINKIEDFKKEGRLLLDAEGALAVLGIDSQIPRESYTSLASHSQKTIDPWSSVVQAAISHSRQFKGGQHVAAQVASRVRNYWENMAMKEERVRANEEKRMRALAKATIKLVTNEWKKAVFHIRQKERVIAEAEQKRLGRQHLDAILNQSGQILEAQQLDLTRADFSQSHSRASSISTTPLRMWESASQDDEDDPEDSELEYESGMDEKIDSQSNGNGTESRDDGEDQSNDIGDASLVVGPSFGLGIGDQSDGESNTQFGQGSEYDDLARDSRDDPMEGFNDCRQLPADDESIENSGQAGSELHSLHSPTIVSMAAIEHSDRLGEQRSRPETPLDNSYIEDEAPFMPFTGMDISPEVSEPGADTATSVASPSSHILSTPFDVDPARVIDKLDSARSAAINDDLSVSWTKADYAENSTQSPPSYHGDGISYMSPEAKTPCIAISVGPESQVTSPGPLAISTNQTAPQFDGLKDRHLSNANMPVDRLVDEDSSRTLSAKPVDNPTNIDQEPVSGSDERSILPMADEPEGRNQSPGTDANTNELDWEPAHYLKPFAVARVIWDPESKIKPPLLLRGSLRPYQQSGLEWLASLHTNNLNGILADEMGLGKTIQTIALLAHLACDRGIWGPHLIIVPTSVLLNWIMEFKKFLPGFQILSYHGSTKRRKELRQGWNNRYAFNVCVTSYSLASRDAHIFKRKAWYYMILDEAHMIKNFKSQRWNILLMFRSFRRLLLTGTPLQNNLTELWALLQFLMSGTNFANLKEFGEWFSNPLERAIEQGTVMDEETQRRVTKLHTVLRPYLLRRLKRDVEKELPSKYDHLVLCRLSKRQRFLYDEFMARAETRDDLQSGVYQKVANILMQLRKVCNHPDLFEVRPIVTSFAMDRSAVADFEIKELLVRRRMILEEDVNANVNLDVLGFQFVQRSNTSLVAALSTHSLEESFTPLFATEHPGEPPPYDTRTVDGYRRFTSHQKRVEAFARQTHMAYLNHLRCKQLPIYSKETIDQVKRLHIPLVPLAAEDLGRPAWFNGKQLASPTVKSYIERAKEMAGLVDRFAFATPAVVARDMPRFALAEVPEDVLSKCFDPAFDAVLHQSSVKLQIAFPDASLLQYDCGKLQELSRLLRERKSGGHRVLIFTQMTKILDILEAFLNFHGYLYLRLDGATKIEDRQYITERFNVDERVFAFIASSRSGGVGINLTGADTVIFYDSDFNPQMDRQCEDRAHRIGQIRDVHIYRFVSQYTVEEAMLRKANQKRSLDDLVIQQGEFDWRSVLGTEDGGAGLSALERALGDVEDVEDAHAAKMAANEEATLEGEDEADFADAEGAGEASTPSAVPERNKTALPDVDGGGGEHAKAEEPEEGETVAEYMISFIHSDPEYFREWRL